ncbi:hypothetical protein BD311DRAFT_766925 [Dichomitus squalens]|uniref:Uncharacterized protein n=1 Tax=Dichomitus squalens TaxID=114155 RepID=A0A4Q9MCJ1_9APHY|nr:hypothetical protein BD311DRAFT_766925 [Dichomitus squalens]
MRSWVYETGLPFRSICLGLRPIECTMGPYWKIAQRDRTREEHVSTWEEGALHRLDSSLSRHRQGQQPV